MLKNPVYKELRLGLINEGQLVERIDRDLLRMQQALVEYAELHGENALKAKGKLVIEITAEITDKSGDSFGLKATTKTTLPNAPALVSIAIAAEGEEGPRLFVRASGSDASTPRQQKLCTDKGETINPATGEVLDQAPPATGKPAEITLPQHAGG